MVHAGFVFLTPLAGLFAVAAIVPLIAFAELLRRDGRVRRVLAMPALSRRARVPLAVALAVVPVLIALAAMQPVLELGRSGRARGRGAVRRLRHVAFDARGLCAGEPNRLDRSGGPRAATPPDPARARRHRVVHGPRAPASPADGRRACIRCNRRPDDRDRAAAAEHVLRDPCDATERTLGSRDAQLLLHRRRPPCRRRLHRR